MSLEEALNRNTEMLERLISVLGSTPFRADPPKGEFSNPTSPPNVQPESSTQKSSQASAPTGGSSSPAVTYDDVKRATNDVSAKYGVTKTKAALSRFGVASAKALAETQWGNYVSYMARVASGMVDPEASHE